MWDRIKQNKRDLSEEELVSLHHEFMCVYGWIPLDELKALPIPTFFGLAEKVVEEKNRREQLRLVLLKFCGVKNPK